MKNTWLSESSLEHIKAVLDKRGYKLGEEIGEGKGSVVFAVQNNSTLCCKVKPYSKETVKRIYYSRAAYRFDSRRFPFLPIPDPNRTIEYIPNSDDLTEESKDWEIEPIVTKEGGYLATIHERLSPIRSFNELELLKMTGDIAETLVKLYDLRFALHGISEEDIMFSYLNNRYVLSDCQKVSRFIDDRVNFRYGNPHTSAPELFGYRYYKSSSVYSLGCVLRKIATRGFNPEKEIQDEIVKLNSAIKPAAILGKTNLVPLPLDDKNNMKYSKAFIRLINKLTAYHHEDRPIPEEVVEAARRLRDMPALLREEAEI